MWHYLARRAVSAVLLALLVSFGAFVLVFASGDPAVAVAGEGATAADAARVRATYHLDRPVAAQYLQWVARGLRGDLGQSYYFHQPVTNILAGRFGVTMTLGACAITLALLVGIPLGVVAACRPNSAVDRFALFAAVVGQAMPAFWLALLLIIVFSVRYPLLPSSGVDTWQGYVLPTVVLGYYAMPAIMRLTRSGMIAVFESDYIRTARAMGIATARIVFKYALRNAMLPVVAVAAAQFGFMLAGSVVIESVFAIPGAGLLAWESIKRSDLPTVQALVLCFSLIYVVLTFCADLVSAWLDPRVRGQL